MEAENPETEAQIEKALKSFCCFLYVGKDRPWYKAKPWNDDDFYLQGERMRNLEILASNKKTELVPIDKIKLAMDSKLIRRPETVMFALAMCARQKKSEKLRASAYYFLAEHCPEWKYFVLFIKYASYLCRVEGSKDRNEDEVDGKKPIGWGHGWKNAVNKWYFTKSVSDLRELVTRHKSGHGWTHKDILKLSHPETCGLEVEKRAILCYVMNGLEAAEKEFDGNDQAKIQLSYIRLAESCKRCQDKDAVVKMIKTGHYPLNTIDYVHPMALRHKEVWLALLETMDIQTILKYLPKFNEFGLLGTFGPATPLIVRALTRKSNIWWNKILPFEILTASDRYEKPPKRNSKENKKQRSPKGKSASAADITTKSKSKNAQTSERHIETETEDVRIPDALRAALTISQTVDITESSERRYLISVRLPGRRRENQCVAEGLALALPLLHRGDPSEISELPNYWPSAPETEEDSEEERQKEDDHLPDETVTSVPETEEDSKEERKKEDDHLPDETVTIFGYKHTDVGFSIKGIGEPLLITKHMRFDEALELLQVPSFDRTMLHVPFGALQWALEVKKPYDVFINVTNEPPTIQDLAFMKFYTMEKQLPDARFINVVVSRVPFQLKEEIWNDSLIVHGFDPHVPWIIEAYVRGLF